MSDKRQDIKDLKRVLAVWSGRVSAASTLLAAGGLAAVIAINGRWLAMGIALYGGYLEPNEPELPFPTVLTCTLLGIGLLSAVCEPIFRKPLLSWLALAGALAAAGVSVAHLMDLVEIAAG